MPLVGTYNPSTFVAGNFATYPQLPPGVTYYQPTMHWLAVGAPGTVQGQTVAVGDLLFATAGPGRTYGQNTYGEQIYGGQTAGDWTVDQVFFLRWDASIPAPIQPPYPNAGCPFTRPDLVFGDWAPGWRLVIDAWYDDKLGSRTYGEDNFGQGIYGSSVVSQARWVDMTHPSFHVETGDGMADGAPRVTVSEVVVTMVDEDGRWLDIATPNTWHQPQPGTPFRVGFIDPQFRYHPLISAQIERIEDVHDGEHPRIVAVRGFGRIMDLTVDIPLVQRPAELASARFNALVAMAGWRWGSSSVVFPQDDAPLLADAQPRDIVVRDELDRTAIACGWSLDSDRWGAMRLRQWPLAPTGSPVVVTDCDEPGDPEEWLVSHTITFANDESQLLNYVTTTNTAVPNPVQVTASEAVSITRFGRRGRAMGFPMSGLPWAYSGTATAWTRRVVNRYAYITRHAESLLADTHADHGWLAVLADLDTGRAVHIERRHPSPLDLDAVLTGWRHVIDPGRWQSTLFVATTTTSY